MVVKGLPFGGETFFYIYRTCCKIRIRCMHWEGCSTSKSGGMKNLGHQHFDLQKLKKQTSVWKKRNTKKYVLLKCIDSI